MRISTLTIAAALLAASPVAFAQTAVQERPVGNAVVPPRTSEGAAAARDARGLQPQNSTNSLENGTASGKGSGPGAGSPNGN